MYYRSRPTTSQRCKFSSILKIWVLIHVWLQRFHMTASRKGPRCRVHQVEQTHQMERFQQTVCQMVFLSPVKSLKEPDNLFARQLYVSIWRRPDHFFKTSGTLTENISTSCAHGIHTAVLVQHARVQGQERPPFCSLFVLVFLQACEQFFGTKCL